MMASLALVLGRLSGRVVVTTQHGGSGFGLHKLMDLTNWYHSHLHVSQFSRRVFGHCEVSTAGVIGGGVSVERFTPPLSRPTRDYVLFTGRLLPHKGIDELILGLPSGVPLIVAGRPFRHALAYRQQLHELAKNRDVRFLEDCSEDVLLELYRNARCVVLPSVYRSRDGAAHSLPELLGLTLLEGMSCGTAAICTNVGGMPEVVEDGVSGFVVPPNDPAALGAALEVLWSNRDLADRMGAAARRRVLEYFTWAAVAERCISTYSQFHL
jgi:glycosyltransferase involved in cell wall biosynthesis